MGEERILTKNAHGKRRVRISGETYELVRK